MKTVREPRYRQIAYAIAEKIADGTTRLEPNSTLDLLFRHSLVCHPRQRVKPSAF